jgi:hypothetical protein
MKTKMKIVLSTLIVLILFPSCQKEKGCIDPTAINYDIDAEVDDGSCIYNTIITGSIIELDAQGTVIMNPPPFPPTVTGDYTKFSFSEGSVVTGDNWDIAFRSTSIIVNGGIPSDSSHPNRTGNAAVYIADGLMNDIIDVDTSLLNQDAATSTAIVDDFGQMQMGWCVYDQMTNIISPIAGKVLVFRTHDNKYAKVEILNFYDEAMSNIYGGFYTFNYVYQSEENVLDFHLPD